MPRTFETGIRVRYKETDAQGIMHHSNYFVYFEQARVEMMRDVGQSYKQMEENGFLFVIAQIGCRYFAPAYFDDLLHIRTTVTKVSKMKIEHLYEVFRGEKLLAQGSSKLGVLSPEGKLCRVPEEFASFWRLPDNS